MRSCEITVRYTPTSSASVEDLVTIFCLPILTGIVIMIGEATIYVKSGKQKIVARSSTEAELVRVSDALSQILWTRELLLHQGLRLGPATVDDMTGHLFLWWPFLPHVQQTILSGVIEGGPLPSISVPSVVRFSGAPQPRPRPDRPPRPRPLPPSMLTSSALER